MADQKSYLSVFKVSKKLIGFGFIAVFVYLAYRSLILQLNQSVTTDLLYFRKPLIITLIGFILWFLLFELSSEWVLRWICIPGHRIRWSETALAFFQSILARYIPGKVWYVVGRTEALAEAEIPRTDVVRSVLYEQAHYFCATTIFTLIIFPFLFLTPAKQVEVGTMFAMLGISTLCAIVWVFWPHKFFLLVNRIFHFCFRDSKVGPLILKGRLFHWQLAFVFFFIVVICQALVIYPLIKHFLPPGIILSPSRWVAILGAYPISRFVGQISSIAPGGLGVREGTYILLVFSILDSQVSTAVVVWARLLSVSSEIILFCLFFCVSKMKTLRIAVKQK
jgi:hypothetical protein